MKVWGQGHKMFKAGKQTLRPEWQLAPGMESRTLPAHQRLLRAWSPHPRQSPALPLAWSPCTHAASSPALYPGMESMHPRASSPAVTLHGVRAPTVPAHQRLLPGMESVHHATSSPATSLGTAWVQNHVAQLTSAYPWHVESVQPRYQPACSAYPWQGWVQAPTPCWASSASPLVWRGVLARYIGYSDHSSRVWITRAALPLQRLPCRRAEHPCYQLTSIKFSGMESMHPRYHSPASTPGMESGKICLPASSAPPWHGVWQLTLPPAPSILKSPATP